MINFVPKLNYYLVNKAITLLLVMLECPLVDIPCNNHKVIVALAMHNTVYRY